METKSKLKNKLLIPMVGVAVLAGGLAYGNYHFYQEKLEKEEAILDLKNELDVLGAANHIEDEFISMSNMRDKLNLDSTIYPINYNNETYYFGIDTIKKQSLDTRDGLNYDIIADAQILKDRTSNGESYLITSLPKILHDFIDENNKKLKNDVEYHGEEGHNHDHSEEGHDHDVSSYENDGLVSPEDFESPTLNYVSRNKVTELDRSLRKEVEEVNKEVSISFDYSVFNQDPLIEQKFITEFFVKEYLLKGKNISDFKLEETEDSIKINVLVDGKAKNYQLNKNTNELK